MAAVSLARTVPVRAVRKARFGALSAAPFGSLLLLACMWLNLNTELPLGAEPRSFEDWTVLIRAVLPIIVLPAAALTLLDRRKLNLPTFSPSQLLMIYGLLAAIAAVVSPQPTTSLYWSITFLATIAAARTFATALSPVASTRQCLQVTWVVMFVVAAIIAYTARGTVFGGAPSAYGVGGDLSGLSRSSGVARWAAVPGLVCVLKAFHARRPALIALYLGAAGAALFIVYRMHSRGAVFGSVAALLFALVTSSRLRRYALPYTLLAVVVLTALETPAVLSARVTEYLHRGQTEEEFRSMTGRTQVYENGIVAFWDAPILGRGQRADRLVGVGHAHNSYLEALLNAGILGGIPYVASWIAGWALFFRLQKRRGLLRPEDRAALLEAGAVMMFFTIRSFPETTTASFAVDLLAMAAVYVYLETLMVSMARRPVGQSATVPLRARAPKMRHALQVAGRSELGATQRSGQPRF
jgi:O-antigen ligase